MQYTNTHSALVVYLHIPPDPSTSLHMCSRWVNQHKNIVWAGLGCEPTILSAPRYSQRSNLPQMWPQVPRVEGTLGGQRTSKFRNNGWNTYLIIINQDKRLIWAGLGCELTEMGALMHFWRCRLPQVELQKPASTCSIFRTSKFKFCLEPQAMST